MQKIWDETFTTRDEKNNVKCVALLSEKNINVAIGARLIGCHNLMKMASEGMSPDSDQEQEMNLD